MTVLESLIINSLNMSSIGSGMHYTSTSLDSIDSEYRSTTLALSVTTILNSIEIPEKVVEIRNAQSYVESLSTEELEELDKLLTKKELEFSYDNITTPNYTNKKYIKEYHKQHK